MVSPDTYILRYNNYETMYQKLKVFLDDMRTPPNGWILTDSVASTIDALKTDRVSHLSLDHDLGEVQETGYDVLVWIEREVVCNQFVPPIITIHSSNPSGRERMALAIESIYKWHKRNL